MRKHYEIWCDGSYRQVHKTLGGAWVRVAPDGEAAEQSIPYPPLQDTHAHGSDIAELYAFTDAMKGVPSGADVIVHMDCRNVIDWLSTEKLSNKDKVREPRIRKAFDAAVHEKQRMKRFEIVYTSDKNSPNMGRAHMLSRAASNAGSKKDRARHAHQNP